jgi:hypothetical protein
MLVSRFAAKIDVFDVEELLPVRLIATTSASIRSASPSPEEPDHLLDL